MVRPVVIVDEKGSVVSAGLMNEKAYRKSIEHNELWTLHAETGRLLPQQQFQLTTLAEREGYYYAAVGHAGTAAEAGSGMTPPAVAAAQSDRKAVGDTGAATHDESPHPASHSSSTATFDALWQVIQQRNVERPEGSYTSYLFREGEEKIRKKTGEEAVELILAREPREIVHESADLVYHLFVLLEATGIGLAPVMDELSRRAT